ncbi:MAG: hypothetical protein B7Y05_04435 [Polynucleobacter sp. 24-46-87]|jgi:hypothetical protein|uniref:hypothetical protein n=1 Tax=unclassified Polynucleobacter TaxID=2640945 RepID=UPI000BD627DE|nr:MULTISPECIES: hypothetical protein [unclassified Polynucleobacter]OYY19030.1 MAG: hypothetical protein B7Y67_06270 [Polynucleobacter sp. 35-46-11]OZA15319.1 MAG: hypothetical protein B7Y05_04435 [Polynucleobacter sp. 24-46-87]OZA76196.1 MAG: hypothetical protein B7X71_09235 [Polynucleobacter sp. 39-46-10]
MSRFKDIHDAWKQGFTDGWQSIKKSSIPGIPPLEDGVPAGVIDQNEYYYEKAYSLGSAAAIQANAGIVKPRPTPPVQP